jgi:hypothetical protein
MRSPNEEAIFKGYGRLGERLPKMKGFWFLIFSAFNLATAFP